jgi:hypothetical protein
MNPGGCPSGNVHKRYGDPDLAFWKGETFVLAKATASETWFCEVLCLLCFLEEAKQHPGVLKRRDIGHSEMCMFQKEEGASMTEFTEAVRCVYSAWKRAAKLCVEKFA